MNFNHYISIFSKCLLFILLSSGCTSLPDQLELPRLFSDHMVLQQQTNARIWGKTNPGKTILAKGSWGMQAETIAREDGSFMLQLPTPEAGGPFELHISAGDTTASIQDVMIGEVWLGSGQSNMEMPVKGWPPNDVIVDSEKEIAGADFPSIRMFTVPRIISTYERTQTGGSWEVSSPETTGDFSATAYFFARKLHQELNIPIGIIHSSWGGTPAESWVSKNKLNEMADFEPIIKNLDSLSQQTQALESWLNALPNQAISDMEGENPWENKSFGDEELAANDISHNEWDKMSLPGPWEASDLGSFDGIIWFRKRIEIPEAWIGKSLTLQLPAIDDMDATYINGSRVGGYERAGFWNLERTYNIAADLISSTSVTISIRVIDTGGGGGFQESNQGMRIHKEHAPEDAISLDGDWAYLPVAEIQNGNIYTYGSDIAAYKSRPIVTMPLNSHTPSVLFNGMISPLVPYTLKGAIWYQGESNVGRASQYQELFPNMIQSWRDVWGLGEFPFYFVQIAPFNYGAPDAISSAKLRDAQRLSLESPHTGMAVTMDIGQVDNIHPGNKQDVGLRLAFWALAKDYGRDNLVYSGPLPITLSATGKELTISFVNIGNGLELRDTGTAKFEIADASGNFQTAKARIIGNQVVVSGDLLNPQTVRYAYTNGASATLFNAEGLPATSFELKLE